MFNVGDLIRVKKEKEDLYPHVINTCGIVTKKWEDLAIWYAFFDEESHNVTVTLLDFEKVG